MGFDLAELTMAVEDAFGFVMPEEDAAGLETVGNLYECVLSRRFHGKRQACLRAVTLHKIRGAMMSSLHIPRKELYETIKLSAIIPWHRRRLWRALQTASGFRLPQLRRPRWVRVLAVLATLAIATLVPVLLSLTLLNGAMLVGILTAFATAHVLSWLTIPLAFEFHQECPTLGQLATATLARNYRTIVRDFDIAVSDVEVWQTLASIVAEQRGVRVREVTKNTPLDKKLMTLGIDRRESGDANQGWFAAGLPCGQDAQLPLPYVVAH